MMYLNMDDSRIVSIAQAQEFIKVARDITFQSRSAKETYQWIEDVLLRFRYYSLRKKEKSILRRYIRTATGYSRSQLTRLITKKKKFGKIFLSMTRRHTFPRLYAAEDIARLIETDNAHNRLAGPATKRIFEREYTVFGDMRFMRLKDISISHIYNLRGTRQYQSHALVVAKTQSVNVAIGERRKPDPQGRPGYLRVDTVHQGDREGEKGVYHINLVDEVTQWEIVGAVEHISEAYLEPMLADAIEQFPFKILGFHSDGGSEYINSVVARLLNKLTIQQTKSQPRHCNDNALVETKNGSIIRKHMGRMHIPQPYAAVINRFYKEYFNGYVNFHRPSGFATATIDRKGKIKKVYKTYLTPFEALRSHLRASKFLKEDVTMEKLEKTAREMSDNTCAIQMQKAKTELFKSFSSFKI